MKQLSQFFEECGSRASHILTLSFSNPHLSISTIAHKNAGKIPGCHSCNHIYQKAITLLKRLLSDALGTPVLLVVGLMPLGIRLVVTICLSLASYTVSTIAPSSVGTPACLLLCRTLSATPRAAWRSHRCPLCE